jgi:hypothetical protein
MNNCNIDLLKTFFKYYLMSMLRENEVLNSSYLEKLKQQYKNMQSSQKIKCYELE